MKGVSRYQLIIEDFRIAESYKPMDFNQQLSALNNKIQKLHERTKSKSVSEDVEEIVVMEKKSEQELTLDCMKTRTDDLSRMTVQVLKHYSKNDVNEFDEGEMRFYEKYVKPIKKHL